NLSADTTRGKRAAAAKGLFNGGKPPFGYTVVGTVKVDRRLAEHPVEAEVLRWLFRTYADTDVSLRGLAERLRERGIPSPPGHPWGRRAPVAKVLGNVLYLGEPVFGRKSYSPFAGSVKVPASTRKPSSGRPRPEEDWVRSEVGHPLLVDRSLFDRV